MLLALAALLPAILFAAIVWRHPERRVAWLFCALVLLYVSPYVLLQGTPASLDFLYDASPWHAMQPPGHLQKNFLLNDIPLGMLPWLEAVRSHWIEGSPPFLNRTTGSGSALWANLHATPLYPTTLWAVLLSPFSWPLAALATKLLAALWGMYLFLGRLSLARGSRIFGAVAYAFGTFTIAFGLFPLTNVTVLLPLLLALLHDATTSWRRAGGATLVTALMLLGGHPESVLHAAFIAVPYALLLVVRANERAAAALRFLSIAVVAALLASPLLLPFAAHLPHSQRMADLAGAPRMLAPAPLTVENLAPFLIPNYFGNPRVHNYRHAFNFNELCSQYTGLATLALAFAAILTVPRRVVFWIVALLILTFLAFQPPFAADTISEIPLLNMTNHGRLRFGIALAIAVLGAHGFELFAANQRRRVIAGLALAAAVSVVTICLLSYPVFAAVGIRRLVFFTELAALASVAFIALMAFVRFEGRGAILTALVFLDLVSAVPLYNPQNGRDLFYPATDAINVMREGDSSPYRITGIARALQPMTATFFGLEDIRVHDPLAFRPYVAILEAAGFDRSTYFGQFKSAPPRPLLNFLGVRFIIDEPAAQLAGYEVAHRGSDATVFRNDEALPRYFVPREVVRSADPAREFLRDGRVYSRMRAQTNPAVAVTLASYERNQASVDVNADQSVFIASSEVALPGWRLFRNGVPWPLETINGAFLGWEVPAGKSRFILAYQPPRLAVGLALGVVGLALLAAMMLARVPHRIESSNGDKGEGVDGRERETTTTDTEAERVVDARSD